MSGQIVRIAQIALFSSSFLISPRGDGESSAGVALSRVRCFKSLMSGKKNVDISLLYYINRILRVIFTERVPVILVSDFYI